MLFIVGFLVVVGTVIGGYSVHGDLSVLWQPIEFVIIFGGAFGAFMIGNSKTVVIGVLNNFSRVITGPKYNKAADEELLGVLFSVFKLAKTKGDLAMEAHVEAPQDSQLFGNFPLFLKDHHAVEFLCDYLRILTLGASNPHEIEAVMEAELWTCITMMTQPFRGPSWAWATPCRRWGSSPPFWALSSHGLDYRAAGNSWWPDWRGPGRHFCRNLFVLWVYFTHGQGS